MAQLAQFRHSEPARHATVAPPATRAERFADRVATAVGSWRFLLAQSIVFAAWIVLNVVGWWSAWDPYPFILLNLALSVQAAYTAPIIMMSQTRQAVMDRHQAMTEYEINAQAALEIKLLHQKIDELRELELEEVITSLKQIHQALDDAGPVRQLDKRAGVGS